MMEEQKLPYGWIVKKSKSHPDRVYYFNVNTGESSWEFPDLIKSFRTGPAVSPVSPPVLTARSLSNEHGPQFPIHQASGGTTTEEAKFSPVLSDHDSESGDSMASQSDSHSFQANQKHGKVHSLDWKNDRTNAARVVQTSDVKYSQGVKQITNKDCSKDLKSGQNIKPTEKQSGLSSTGRDRLTRVNRPTKDDMLKAKSCEKKVIQSVLSPKKGLQTKCRETVMNNEGHPKCRERKEKQERMVGKHNLNHSDVPVSGANSKIHKTVNSKSKHPSVDANKSSSSGNKRKVCDTSEPSTKKQKTESVNASNSLPKRNKLLSPDKRNVSEVYPRSSKTEEPYTDKRKVVKTGKVKAEPRSVKVKDSTVSLKSRSETATGTSMCERQTEPDLTVVTNLDLTTDRSPSPVLQWRGSDGSSNSGDRNNNSSKTMVMNMDKLLTIQSWIDNLGEGSDSPRLEFYAKFDDTEANVRQVKVEKARSETSASNIRPQRGWPGEAKPVDVSEREIVEMEVEDCELPEYKGVEEEDMDIDVILHEVRHQLISSDVTPETSLARSIVDTATSCTDHPNQGLYVVVDTNVLMTNIHFLEDFKDQNIAGFGRPVLYIPWIVLQELDHLKEAIKPGQLNLSVVTQHKAGKGIRFLKELFSSQHPRIQGQTPAQADKAASEFKAACNDDRVLQSCLQCQKLYPNSRVVLLTNDNNLSNKTMVTGVPAFSSKEIVAGLQKLPPLERSPSKVAPGSEWPDQNCSRDHSLITEPVGPAVVTTPTAHSVLSPYKSAISPAHLDGTLHTPNSKMCTPSRTVVAQNSSQQPDVLMQSEEGNFLQTPLSNSINEGHNSSQQADVHMESSGENLLQTPQSSSTVGVHNSSQQPSVPMQSSGGDCVQLTPQYKGAISEGEATRTPVGQNSRPSPVSAKKCIADKLLHEERNYTMENLVDDLYCKMKMLLKEGFGCVLEVEMRKAYEDIWLDIVLKKPPWSLMDILLCWKKHWIAVFGMVFSRPLIHNIERLIQHFSTPKGHTIHTLLQMSRDSLHLLRECVNRKLYGEPMVRMKECVQCILNLCDNFDKGTITIEVIPSLDQYLKSKLVPSSSTKPSQSTAKHKLDRSNSGVDMQTGPQPELHSAPGHNTLPQSATHTSQSTSKLVTNHSSGPLISNQTGSSYCVQEVTNVVQTGTQDFTAGHLLEHIWQFIYKYYDNMYKALSNQPTHSIVEQIKGFLQVLVPTTKQLRHHYARVLELQISELIHHEDMFVSLCNLCNTFFKHINMEADAPAFQVSANQFLMLYGSVQHRSTLNTFLQQLDDMLIHLVKCVQIVSPNG